MMRRHVVKMGETMNAYRLLVGGKLLKKLPF
jgi:hypothetical protein